MTRNADRMAEPGQRIDRNSDTGEFITDESDRARLSERLGKRRRRRRKRKSSASTHRLLLLVSIGLLCFALVMIGVFVGAKFQPIPTNDESYRNASQERKMARQQYLSECTADGYSVWTCNRFDQKHFDIAKKLDEFNCQAMEDTDYRCSYALGSAKIVVTLPQTYEENGKYRVTTTKPSAIVSHSDQNDKYFISVSEKGYIEIREQGRDVALFAINPVTGRLNSLQ